MSIYQVSRALAHYNSWHDVERTLTGIEMLHGVKVDWHTIKQLWRDLQHTPKPYAL